MSKQPARLAGGDTIQPPEWMAVSYNRFNIATIHNGKIHKLTNSNRDFKPVSSPDGKFLVFFRVMTYGDGSFETWRTALCVIGFDGSNFRQLTSGKYVDYNPTFMRDGTNRIVFNRYNQYGKRNAQIFLTTISGSPGSEQKVSHPTEPSYEWVYTSLKDGRLFVHRHWKVYLLTINPGGLGTYEEVAMPTTNYFHKANISPSETKITYMFDNDDDGATYNDAQIAWAKLDVKGLRVYDQVLITDKNLDTIEEYPKWNADGTIIYYDSNKAGAGGTLHQVFAYRLADGMEKNISVNQNENYQFPSVRGIPK